MSEALHAVILEPNFTGCGNFFDLTPAHHVLLPTGNTCRIVERRTKPVSGNTFGVAISIVAPDYSCSRWRLTPVVQRDSRSPQKVQICPTVIKQIFEKRISELN